MAAPGLTPEELATYRKDGQIIPRFRLSDSLLEELRGAAADLVAARPDLPPEFIPLPHVPKDDSAEARELAGRFLDLAHRPEILDLIESVIGPDIVFWTAALFCKPGALGKPIPWHQDGIYWPLKPMASVTVWIALDPARADNGCLTVIPGSHLQGFLDHETSEKDGMVLNTEIAENRIDLGKARYVELEPGEVSLHDAFIVHGSAANTSGRRRAGLTLRYMPATTLYDRKQSMATGSNTVSLEFAKRPIWLVRGQDRAGNDYTVGHWEQSVPSA